MPTPRSVCTMRYRAARAAESAGRTPSTIAAAFATVPIVIAPRRWTSDRVAAGAHRRRAETRLAAGRLRDPARAVDAAERPVIRQRVLRDVDVPRLALGVAQLRLRLQRQASDHRERRLVLGPLDAGVLDPERRVLFLPVDRHPSTVSSSWSAKSKLACSASWFTWRSSSSRSTLGPCPDRLAGVVRRGNRRGLHRFVRPVQERHVAPEARLLVGANSARAAAEAVPRGLEEALQVLERQRQQRPQGAEQSLRAPARA